MSPRERSTNQRRRPESTMQQPLLTESHLSGELDFETSDGAMHLSPNVRNTLLYTIIAYVGRSIWNQSVLPTYVYYLVDKRPEAVGYISGVIGISQLVTSFPAGYIADHHRRDFLLKSAAVVGIFAILSTILAVDLRSYVSLLVALAVWGVFWGMANTALGALFADSIRDGERTHYFTQRSTLITAGNTAGPIVTLIMFLLLGNTWTVGECAVVIILGQAICFPSIVLLCFFNDDDAVAHNTNNLENSEESLAETLIEENPDVSTIIESESSWVSRFFVSKRRLIPVLISLADIMAGLASGMSIRYFPIFFVENLQLSPVQVQLMYIFAPAGQALVMNTAKVLADKFGRCKVAVVNKWIGVALMVAVIVAYEMKVQTWIICVIYILRTSFINSTGALTRSVLMDNVPKHERGRWSALESVNMFSWSGSAVLGGVLVAAQGIMFNFTVTAGLQFVATIPLVVLALFLNVEKNESDDVTRIDYEAPEAKDSCDDEEEEN